MSGTTTVWPAEALDAVSIWVPEARIAIESGDGEQVQLEGDFGGAYSNGGEPEIAGRWLRLHARNERPFEMRLHLRLPKSKAWVVDLTTLWGQVEINGVQARLQVPGAKRQRTPGKLPGRLQRHGRRGRRAPDQLPGSCRA